jgi:hypothetical protein
MAITNPLPGAELGTPSIQSPVSGIGYAAFAVRIPAAFARSRDASLRTEIPLSVCSAESTLTFMASRALRIERFLSHNTKRWVGTNGGGSTPSLAWAYSPALNSRLAAGWFRIASRSRQNRCSGLFSCMVRPPFTPINS